MIEMNMTARHINQAIEAVCAAYEPGVVAYYAQLQPDQWQAAHDNLERILVLDEASAEVACQEFVTRCLALIDGFKKRHPPTKTVAVSDAAQLADHGKAKPNEEIKFRARWSTKKRECYQCGGKSDLEIESYGPDALEVRVVCKEHKGRKSA